MECQSPSPGYPATPTFSATTVADAAAKEGLLLPAVTLHIPPSLSAIQASILTASQRVIRQQHLSETLQQSRSATWYQHATGLQPLVVPPSMPRQLSCILHRLRLGYPCREELQQELRSCEHCDEETEAPLHHYLLECQATQALRRRAPPRTAEDVTEAAAAMARRVVEDPETYVLLARMPPPR